MRKFDRDGTTIKAPTDLDESKLVTWAKESLHRPGSFGYFGDDKDRMFVTWSLGPVIEHRDSGISDKSNAKALKDFLESDPSLEEEWKITGCSHWAVGWVDHLSFHAVDDSGAPTRIARILFAWFDYLKNEYPIADESLYAEMESEAGTKWIEEEGPRVAHRLGYQLPEDWCGRVLEWFDTNNPGALESVDDQGAAPSEDDFTEAFDDLGFAQNA